jgi:uncharacterized protein YjiS (DUF1127 family)
MTTSSMPTAARLSLSRHGPSPIAPLARCASFAAALSRRAVQALRTWNRRLDDRAFLSGLQGHELSEMGMTPMARDGEARKPFWRA